MKLSGNTKSRITKGEKGENMPHLEITEVVLIHCNNNQNNSQQDLRVPNRFALNKSFGQLLDISTKSFYILKNF